MLDLIEEVVAIPQPAVYIVDIVYHCSCLGDGSTCRLNQILNFIALPAVHFAYYDKQVVELKCEV